MKRRRTALRNVIMKTLFGKAEPILLAKKEDIGEMEKRKLKDIYENLKGKETLIKELDEQISEVIDPAELEDDIENSVTYELEFAEHVGRIKYYLEQINVEDSESTITVSSNIISTKPGVNLPTLNIPKFDGDPLMWQSFIDSFEASVHSRNDLSPVQKFQYLNSYLVKAAKKCVEGFPLTNDNYAEALDLLKTRYGNPQLVISAHMAKIMQIEKITRDRNTTELRNLLDTVESHVRSLGSQGVNKEHFGALLIPILQEKLYPI